MTVRKVEMIRDRIMSMCGTTERLIEADDFLANHVRVTMQWRKPLAIEEVARLAPTVEVRERRGRA
jgi:phage-related protein